MGRRSRVPGSITNFSRTLNPKEGWRRFRFSDPNVTEGGPMAANEVYASLTEDAVKTRWVTPAYSANSQGDLVTSGTGAANGRIWSMALTDSLGAGINLSDNFLLRVMIEFQSIDGSDWGASYEAEPWIAIGFSSQAAVADIPTNNYLAMSVNYYGRHATTQYNKPRIGYNKGPISGSSRTFHYTNNNNVNAGDFPTYYYGNLRIGPDMDDTRQLNHSISVRCFDSNLDHFGPSQWKTHEPGDADNVEDTGQAYLFVALTPEGANGVNLYRGEAITTDFRVWFMVETSGPWIPEGNP